MIAADCSINEDVVSVLFAVVDDDDDDVCSTPPVNSNIICMTATSIKINFKFASHSTCTFNWFVYYDRTTNSIDNDHILVIFFSMEVFVKLLEGAIVYSY
jgi:hypothetical protein